MGVQTLALHMAHHIHTLAVARQTRAFITACLRADTSSKQQAIWGLDLSRVAGTLPVSMAALMVGAAAADIQEVILEDNMVVTITVNMEEATAATVVVMAVDTVVAMADMELDHQYTSDPVPMHGYHGGHGMGGHGMGGHGMGGHGMGGHGMGGHGMGGHSAMGMGGHGRPGMHPAASMVSIAHDPHGMFSHPSNMSRMHMGHGRAHFSSKSIPATCPRCKHDIMTLVRRRPNVLNVAASTGAVVAGLIFKLPVALLPLAMLPLQVKALQPKVHYCPRCNYKMGKNVKISVPFDRNAVQPSPDR
ncbi:hypothetical protein GGH14_003457 [Coemansia sp. RSA 370]|nr:hypothetical protein J3F81_003303 [Coemansia sp. RSA 371]KAJ2276768.1 hypothetical protein GGH14_003457 [Coemansia sp. RSA 370]